MELKESERLIAHVLADKGLSYGEIAHRILEKRSAGMQRKIAEEVAMLFGRRLQPERTEKESEHKLTESLLKIAHNDINAFLLSEDRMKEEIHRLENQKRTLENTLALCEKERDENGSNI